MWREDVGRWRAIKREEKRNQVELITCDLPVEAPKTAY